MQDELNFNNPGTANADGVTRWRRERAEERLAIARKLGLPIGQDVEVWLRGGVRLRGRLEWCASQDAELAVGGIPFLVGELESCIRI